MLEAWHYRDWSYVLYLIYPDQLVSNMNIYFKPFAQQVRIIFCRSYACSFLEQITNWDYLSAQQV